MKAECEPMKNNQWIMIPLKLSDGSTVWSVRYRDSITLHEVSIDAEDEKSADIIHEILSHYSYDVNITASG